MNEPTLTWLKCAACKEQKPITHFHQRASSPTGYAPSCRQCINEKRRRKKAAPASTATQLKTLAKKGDLKKLKILIEQTNASSFNSLLQTCVSPYVAYPKTDAHPQIARFLIRQGADPNARSTMLSLAAKTGQPALVAVLIEEGALVDFFSAAAILDLAAVKQYLKNDRSLVTATDDNGLTGLHHCAGSALGWATAAHQEQQLQLIDLLLATGSDPDLEVDIGMAVTPLVACCQSGGSVPVIHALVRGGANPNHRNALKSALRYFKKQHRSENLVADALVECGCIIDALIDDAGRTCLHLYSHHEELQAVSWLLTHGASVHARTADGRTPLHLAADRNNNTTVLELLLHHGADITATDALGQQPIDYARKNNKKKIIALLHQRQTQ